jgi:poly(A) polymerase
VADLQKRGFATYFVGGCVRDLLLGRKPKDCDVATQATPNELKRAFRNCRIIGRRFRLAHVFFGPKIIEVSTFRGRGAEGVVGPDDMDEIIERTNTFGTPDQDARSRDFTANGLFYDPVAHTIIDYVGGTEHVQQRRLHTIGDPDARLAEDPVRILRAIKFASRLDFSIDPKVREAMSRHAPLIAQCPPPRVTEEILRIAESGYAEKAFRLMHDTGVLSPVLPELARLARATETRGRAAPATSFFQTLRRLDRMVRAHGGVSRDFVLTALYYVPSLAHIAESGSSADWGEASYEWFLPIRTRMHVPQAMHLRFSRLLSLIQRFLEDQRVRSARTAAREPGFSQALALLKLHVEVFGEGHAAYERWGSIAAEEGVVSSPSEPPLPAPERTPRPSDPPGKDRGPRGRSRRRR